MEMISICVGGIVYKCLNFVRETLLHMENEIRHLKLNLCHNTSERAHYNMPASIYEIFVEYKNEL